MNQPVLNQINNDFRWLNESYGNNSAPLTTQGVDSSSRDRELEESQSFHESKLIKGPHAYSKTPDKFSTRHNYATYKYDYYAGSQAKVYFGDVWVDDIITIQWSSSQNKTPIYGYASQNFDAVAKGTFLVEGSLTIAFKEVGYLNVIMNLLKRQQQDKITYDEEGKPSYIGANSLAKENVKLRLESGQDIADVPADGAGLINVNHTPSLVRQNQTIEEILDILQSQNLSSLYDANGQPLGDGTKDFEDYAELLEDSIWGDSNNRIYSLQGFHSGRGIGPNGLKGTNPFTLLRPDEFDLDNNGGLAVARNGYAPTDNNNILNIMIGFGDLNDLRAEHTLIVLNDVHFRSSGMLVAPNGEPIAEVYNFFSRDINKTITNTTFNINPSKFNMYANVSYDVGLESKITPSRLQDIDKVRSLLDNKGSSIVRIKILSYLNEGNWTPTQGTIDLSLSLPPFSPSPTSDFTSALGRYVTQSVTEYYLEDSSRTRPKQLVLEVQVGQEDPFTYILEQIGDATANYRVLAPSSSFEAVNIVKREDFFKVQGPPTEEDTPEPDVPTETRDRLIRSTEERDERELIDLTGDTDEYLADPGPVELPVDVPPDFELEELEPRNIVAPTVIIDTTEETPDVITRDVTLGGERLVTTNETTDFTVEPDIELAREYIEANSEVIQQLEEYGENTGIPSSVEDFNELTYEEQVEVLRIVESNIQGGTNRTEGDREGTYTNIDALQYRTGEEISQDVVLREGTSQTNYTIVPGGPEDDEPNLFQRIASSISQRINERREERNATDGDDFSIVWEPWTSEQSTTDEIQGLSRAMIDQPSQDEDSFSLIVEQSSRELALVELRDIINDNRIVTSAFNSTLDTQLQTYFETNDPTELISFLSDSFPRIKSRVVENTAGLTGEETIQLLQDVTTLREQLENLDSVNEANLETYVFVPYESITTPEVFLRSEAVANILTTAQSADAAFRDNILLAGGLSPDLYYALEDVGFDAISNEGVTLTLRLGGEIDESNTLVGRQLDVLNIRTGESVSDRSGITISLSEVNDVYNTTDTQDEVLDRISEPTEVITFEPVEISTNRVETSADPDTVTADQYQETPSQQVQQQDTSEVENVIESSFDEPQYIEIRPDELTDFSDIPIYQPDNPNLFPEDLQQYYMTIDETQTMEDSLSNRSPLSTFFVGEEQPGQEFNQTLESLRNESFNTTVDEDVQIPLMLDQQTNNTDFPTDVTIGREQLREGIEPRTVSDINTVLGRITDDVSTSITQASRDYGIPEESLYALGVTESSFEQSSVSEDTAVGVFQVREIAFQDVQLRSPYRDEFQNVTFDDLRTDTDLNIRAGAAYFDLMRNTVGSDPNLSNYAMSNGIPVDALAAAAYNAGVTGFNQALRQRNGRDILSSEYQETRQQIENFTNFYYYLINQNQ